MSVHELWLENKETANRLIRNHIRKRTDDNPVTVSLPAAAVSEGQQTME